jgi:hypothetical protein
LFHAALCYFAGLTRGERIVSEKAKLEQAIRASIGWAKEKDFNLLHAVIANDSSYVEVDPG